MWCPTVQQVLLFHDKLIQQTGGCAGVRSLSLIESALNRFHTSFDGEELYPSIEEKAAAAACGLIQNHGFTDGNKRIGAAVLLLILRKNKIALAYTQEELISIILEIASSKADIPELVSWIHAHKQS